MMLSPLIRASLDGAIVVALVWIVSRTITALTPSVRTASCGARPPFIVALAWISPIALPILPTIGDGRVNPGRVDRESTRPELRRRQTNNMARPATGDPAAWWRRRS
jgi:hypothetical protein